MSRVLQLTSLAFVHSCKINLSLSEKKKKNKSNCERLLNHLFIQYFPKSFELSTWYICGKWWRNFEHKTFLWKVKRKFQSINLKNFQSKSEKNTLDGTMK